MAENENPPVIEKKEEEEIVITKKDPKRVEQGKRLAAISKEAKEKKMRERIREEEFSYLPWMGYGISIVSSLALFYFVLFSGSPEKKEEPKELYPMTIIKETPPKKPEKKFENFS